MKNKGNTLIECIVAILILSIGILGTSKGIIDYYGVLETNLNEERIESILESVKGEIQYNMTLCEVINLFQYKGYIRIEEGIERKIVDKELKDIIEESGEIEISIGEQWETGIEIIIGIDNFEHKFRKEKWMEI